MKPPRELRLNSVQRFQKKSPRLHLEEYSHCEVPAGCGGAVLRWVNDASPRALDLSADHGGETASVWINGEAPDSPWLIPVGGCVLAVEVHAPAPGVGQIMAAGKDRDKRLVFITLPDGSWRCSVDEPDGDAWKQPGFDDSGWIPMQARSMPPPGEHDGWRRVQLEAAGAVGLGLPVGMEPGRRLWIRRAFGLGRQEQCSAAVQAEVSCLGLGKCAVFFDALEPGNLCGFKGNSMVFGRPGNLGLTTSDKQVYVHHGRHVMGVKVTAPHKQCAVIAAVRGEDGRFLAASAAGERWRVTAEEPPPEWLQPDFDDSGWASSVPGQIALDKLDRATHFSDLEQLRPPAAGILAPPAEVLARARRWLKSGAVWFRHVFEYPGPEDS